MKGPTAAWAPSPPRQTAFSGDGNHGEKTKRVPALVLEFFNRFFDLG
jgi:hypothetical protein